MDEAVVTADCSAGAMPGPVVARLGNLGTVQGFASGQPEGDPQAWPAPTNKALDLLVTTAGTVAGPFGLGGAGYVRRVAGQDGDAWVGLNALTAFWRAHCPEPEEKYYASGLAYSHQFRRLLVARAADVDTVRIHWITTGANTADPSNWQRVDVRVRDARHPGDIDPLESGLAMCEVPDGSLLMAVTVRRRDRYDLDLYRSIDGGDTWELVNMGLLAATFGFPYPYAHHAVYMSVSGDYVRIILRHNEGTRVLVSPDRGASWSYHREGPSLKIPAGHPENQARLYLAMCGVDDTSGTFLVIVPNETLIDVYVGSGMDNFRKADLTVGLPNGEEPLAAWLTRDPDRIWMHVMAQNQDTGGVDLLAWVIDPASYMDRLTWSYWGAIDRYGKEIPQRMPYNTRSVWADESIVLFGSIMNPHTPLPTEASDGCMLMIAGQWDRAPMAPTKTPYGARSSTWWRSDILKAASYEPLAVASDAFEPFDSWLGWMGNPHHVGYTFTGTATPVIHPDHVTVSAAVGSGFDGYWSFPAPLRPVLISAIGDAGCIHAIMRVESSNRQNTLTEHIGIKMEIGSVWSIGGEPGVNVTIRMTATHFSVWDNVANVSLFNGTIPANTRVEWRVGFASNLTFEVRWRALENNAAAEDPWETTGILEASPYNAPSSGIHIGILQSLAGGIGPAIVHVYEYKVRTTNVYGQAPSADELPMGMLGAPLTRGGMHVANGLRVSWGGSGALQGDAYSATVDYTRGPENLLLDSPRLMWDSGTPAQCGPTFRAGRSPTMATARWEVDTIALFGTVDRTATIEFSNEDSPAAWALPAYKAELSADLYTGLTVLQAQGSAVRLSGALPQHGGSVNLFIQFTSGPNAGQTHRIYQDPGTGSGWVQLAGEASAEVYAPGTQAVIYGDRMVWHGPMQRYRYFRVLFPDVSSVPDVIERSGARPGGTASGTHRLGSIVPGVWVPFEVPMDWSFSDYVEPNTLPNRTASGITWEHTEGPDERVIRGRIVGDVSEFRAKLRRILSAHHGYSRAPAGLVLNGAHPGPEDLLLVRWRSGSEQDEAAWFPDENGHWRTAGDADVVCEEVV